MDLSKRRLLMSIGRSAAFIEIPMSMQVSELKPKISVIIPVYNASDMLKLCLSGVASSDYPNYECLVVDDGSTDDTKQIVMEYGYQLVEIPEGPKGPAHARNQGVLEAIGEIIFFIDSDVVIKADTLRKIAQSFIDYPEYDAMFGSYDEDPGDGQFLSLFKNLTHHFVHQQANREGHSFWTGCGAIRRDIFLEMGGFDVERYPRPSIEDIELGIRLRAAGHRILVNKDIQVKHLKRWTFLKLIKTDLFDRGIPWTMLILNERALPNDMNLNHSQRLSALLLILMLVDLALSVLLTNKIILLPILAFLFLAVVSSWQLFEGQSMFRMGTKAEILTFSTMIVTSVLAFYLEHYDLLFPLVFLTLVLLISKLLPPSAVFVHHILFALVIVAFVIGFLLLFLDYPAFTVLPFVIGIILIFWLNRDYYLFFVRIRGPLFALAVLPFQILYYLYSLVALLAGYVLYLFNTRGRLHTKSEKQS